MLTYQLQERNYQQRIYNSCLAMHEICFDEDEDAECRQELTLIMMQLS